MNEQMNEWINKRTIKWINERTNDQMNEWMNKVILTVIPAVKDEIN